MKLLKISIRRVFYLFMKNIANKGIKLRKWVTFVNSICGVSKTSTNYIVLIKLSLPYIKAALLTK